MSVDPRVRMTSRATDSVSIMVFMRVVSLSRASVGGRGWRELYPNRSLRPRAGRPKITKEFAYMGEPPVEL